MRRNSIYAAIICLFFVSVTSGIIIKAFEDYQALERSRVHLENYRNAPRELFDPVPSGPNTVAGSRGPVIGKLIIPSIGVRCWIREDTVNAYESVYHYPESVMPGSAGDCGILGHRTTYSGPFRRIGALRRGDTVIIEDHLSSMRYVYVVTSNGDDIRWDYKVNPVRFAQVGEARLMLITCYPPGKKKAAWITHCKLVRNENI
ncbi:sortase [Methanothermobacter sp.]|uniref:class E sortase n=1 Tax=Methanothermobacter sp. TaxID=1884223 RepID=UPI00261A128A|nr:sortase [Methanothermobacter sp.]MDI9615298.1 sortase [Methanothermobacter sp.]